MGKHHPRQSRIATSGGRIGSARPSLPIRRLPPALLLLMSSSVCTVAGQRLCSEDSDCHPVPSSLLSGREQPSTCGTVACNTVTGKCEFNAWKDPATEPKCEGPYYIRCDGDHNLCTKGWSGTQGTCTGWENKECVYQFFPESAINCKGDVLASNERLYPNEYICTNKDGEEYRFGLSSDGTLQEVHVAADGTESVYWSPEKAGIFLRMEFEGNLVLEDEDGNIVWTNDCFGEEAVLTFHPVYPGTGAVIYLPHADPYKSIWSVAPWEEYGYCHPPIKCREVIGGTSVLRRDEYLCVVVADDEWTWRWKNSFRFGIGNNGMLALFLRNEPIWSPVPEGGEKLRVGRSGLYQDDLYLTGSSEDPHDIMWHSGCKSDGNKVRMTPHGVLMTDNNGDTSWYVSYDGEESDCFPDTIPQDLCAQVSPIGNKCRVRMIDHLNIWYTTLEVEEVSPNKYVVTDNINARCEEPWPVDVEKLETGALIIKAGGPRVTCKELMDGWQMKDNQQLNFLPDTFGDEPEENPCTDFGRNLIFFLIMEWFYFG